MLKNRATALLTLLVKRLVSLSLYSFDNCTRLLGATLECTSARRPQCRSNGHDEQGPLVADAAEEEHIDGAFNNYYWLTESPKKRLDGK